MGVVLEGLGEGVSQREGAREVTEALGRGTESAWEGPTVLGAWGGEMGRWGTAAGPRGRVEGLQDGGLLGSMEGSGEGA